MNAVYCSKRHFYPCLAGYVLFVLFAVLFYRHSHVYHAPVRRLSPQGQNRRDGVLGLPICAAKPGSLVGEVPFDTDEVHLHDGKESFRDVSPGGHWEPKNCKSRHQVAVIIPFQDPFHDRSKNLKILVRQLHTILQRQLLSYTVYVSKQNGTSGWFNKGLMMNVAFREAMAESRYDCLVFHDVDLIPVDDRNIYTCESEPKHMCAHINNKTVTYRQATGGVLAMTPAHFQKLNGFSNKFWGWGNEDDNMYDRMLMHGFKLIRASPHFGRYIHLKHKRTYKGTGYRPKSRDVNLMDGLNSMTSSGYRVKDTKYLPLFTWIQVNITQPS